MVITAKKKKEYIYNNNEDMYEYSLYIKDITRDNSKETNSIDNDQR